MNNKNWKRSFYVMWAGQAVSVLTSSILQMALIWYITQISGSALMLSLASIAGFLPSAVLGLFAGTLVDRVQRKVAVIGADLFIAAVSLALVLVSLSGQLPVWVILVVLTMRSIGTAFHTPAINAATPLIVPAAQLTRCAGMIQALQTIGNIAGIAAAGVLYPICSMSTLVMFDVGGAVAASIATALIAIPSHLDTDVPQQKKNLFRETIEGYQILKNDRGLFALTWTAALFMIIWSPLGALFPLMSLDVFGGTTVQASMAEIAFSAGMLAGGTVLGVWGGIKDRGKEIVLSVVIVAVPVFVSGVLPQEGFSGFVVCCVMMGLAVPFYNGPVTALMQERVAPEYLGRVFGLYGSVASLAMPVGLGLSGAFADRIGISNWFALSGILLICVAVLMFAIPAIRKIDKKE